MSETDYSVFLPELIVSLTGIVVMLLVPFLSRERQNRLGFLALLGLAGAIGVAWGQADMGSEVFFNSLFQDGFGQLSRILFFAVAACIIIASQDYLQANELPNGEIFALLLFATVGMCVMSISADLIITFLGLETLSIAIYVLAGCHTDRRQSNESGLKYFLLGAFSTAFFLYGVALIYGATGTTSYLKIAEALQETSPSPMAVMGLGLLLVGFGFKAALAPFHIWTPDVYEGSPMPITAYLAVGSKAAAVLSLVRILYQALPDLSGHWQTLLWGAAILSMIFGNLAALTQSNLKRMLAYSSIAHAGYLLVGVTSFNRLGFQSVFFYLTAYALMTLGAFAVIQMVGRGETNIRLEDYRGIGRRQPFLAAALSVFLVSMAGIPATGGFTGKLFLLAAAVQNRMYGLAVVVVIGSAIGLYYYLRVIVYMFMYEESDGPAVETPMPFRLLLLAMVMGTFLLGLLPGALLHFTEKVVNF